MATTYRAETEEDFTRTIGEFVEEGYDVKRQGEDSATLVKKEVGGAPMWAAHWILLFLTVGVGNVILLIAQMFGAFKETVKVRRVDR